MSRLSEIPVRVEGAAPPTPPDRGLGGGVVAVLHEVAARLEALTQRGEPGSIDLATMPLAPADFDALRVALGEGEVAAEVDADGRSRVRETATHGVWWIAHRDADDNVLAEFIEITTVPAILRTAEADLTAGLERLRAHLAEHDDQPPSAGGDQHA